MSRLPPLLLVIIVWAAIFLPALGLFEIKGEEGRRILPAVAMLESGNYIVPQVGGEPYYRKPPLINWLIAASFKIFRVRNEWTARIPSVLCVLAVAIALVTVARASLGRVGSTMAALVWLTNLGTIEKGRLVEIEALYISLCGLAIIFWLSWWDQKRSPWLMWIVPFVFLGLGWLAKGPTLLFFFYAVVFAILWQSKQWRLLLHPAHFAGIIVMLGIFASWAIPFIHMTEAGRATQKWSSQFVGRVTGEIFHFQVWILTIPRALAYFLPWLLLLPLLRLSNFRDERQQRMARALIWAMAVPFTIINLAPGAAPRYSLPVMTPFSWLLGMSFAAEAFTRPSWLGSPEKPWWPRVAAIFVGIAMVAGVIGYPVASPFFKHRQKVKSVADKINAAVPQTEKLYAVDPNYQPLFFYMHAPVTYVSTVEEVPYEARYFLVRPHDEQTALRSEQWSPRHARQVLRVKDYRDQTLVLFVIDA